MWRLFLIVALVSGCTNVSQPLNPSKMYKRDVRIKHGGTEYIGVAVLPGGEQSYKLELTFAGELDLFTFRSCHREVTQEEAGGGRIFGKRNKVEITYVPVSPLETDKFCPIEIGGYERDGGRHSWAFIDFETPFEKMPAMVLCNGRRHGYKGVSVCQSPAGLMQQIVFSRAVTVLTTNDCPTPTSEDGGKTFDFNPALGRCVYSFRAVDAPREFHRLVALGYEEVMIRKGGE